MATPICPECAQQKCRNCAGEALNEASDTLVSCRCPDCAELAKEIAVVIEERGREWWAE